MSKKYKNNEEYTWEFNEKTQEVTKTNKLSGQVYVWKAKPRPKGPKCNPSNGATIEKLQEAGHSVRVKHFRWAEYAAIHDSFIKKKKSLDFTAKPHPICVPSTFRKDPMYYFLPRGGYTHVVIKPKNSDKYICLSSECSTKDPFCYAIGVEKALERLSSFELGYLGLEFHE